MRPIVLMSSTMPRTAERNNVVGRFTREQPREPRRPFLHCLPPPFQQDGLIINLPSDGVRRMAQQCGQNFWWSAQFAMPCGKRAPKVVNGCITNTERLPMSNNGTSESGRRDWPVVARGGEEPRARRRIVRLAIFAIEPSWLRTNPGCINFSEEIQCERGERHQLFAVSLGILRRNPPEPRNIVSVFALCEDGFSTALTSHEQPPERRFHGWSERDTVEAIPE